MPPPYSVTGEFYASPASVTGEFYASPASVTGEFYASPASVTGEVYCFPRTNSGTSFLSKIFHVIGTSIDSSERAQQTNRTLFFKFRIRFRIFGRKPNQNFFKGIVRREY